MIKDRKIKTAVVSFLLVTAFNIIGSSISPTLTAHIMPFIFLLIPLIIQRKINLTLDLGHFLIGLIASVSIILPVYIYLKYIGTIIEIPPLIYIVITYLLVALPEEAFFRGFLMDSIGCNYKGILTSSLFFSTAHLHRFILYGDYLAPLTFFPALIMGYLYMKTKNILPSALFHGTCNIVLFIIR